MGRGQDRYNIRTDITTLCLFEVSAELPKLLNFSFFSPPASAVKAWRLGSLGMSGCTSPKFLLVRAEEQKGVNCPPGCWGWLIKSLPANKQATWNPSLAQATHKNYTDFFSKGQGVRRFTIWLTYQWPKGSLLKVGFWKQRKPQIKRFKDFHQQTIIELVHPFEIEGKNVFSFFNNISHAHSCLLVHLK